MFTPKSDFSAEIQIFIEYFYPLGFNFNADFQKVNTEIPFTPSYLELWTLSVYLYILPYALADILGISGLQDEGLQVTIFNLPSPVL